MAEHPLAGPVVLLLVWSLFMWMWMYAVRFPAMKKAGIDPKNKVGGTGKDLDAVLPPEVQWKAHNYNHLMEQPTIFYPAVVIIALMGSNALDPLVAWIYVGLRIIHSIWQATVNVVRIRFLLFLLSTFAMVYLAYRAVALTVFADPGVLA